MKFVPPFHVEDGIIYDSDNKKVKLWGVNYYTPFNHNYYNIAELGKDHFKAIDEDLGHLKLMGVDFIRMHLYDREISDRFGYLVENHNMEVFDYLVDQCEKNGVFLMLAPIAWWNTVNNQIMQDRLYAYWHMDSQEAFGFSNFYSCDSMLWDSGAIECQKRYLEGLFSRRSAVSGRKLASYRNIIAMELFNEALYPEKWQIEKEPEAQGESMATATFSRGKQRLKLLSVWEDFKKAHSGEKDEDKLFSLFRANILKNYFSKLFPIVDKYFEGNVIKAQFSSYSGIPPEDLKETIENSGVEAYTIGTYLNVNKFEAESTDSANHLFYARKWFEKLENADYGNLARISYEFNATASVNAYPLAAIAAMYAKHDVQLAAFFTYTPATVAAWNPGWLVHYMNMEHTPSRSAGFAAAGEIFRNHGPADDIKMEEDSWYGCDYGIERKDDLVYFKSETMFRYSNSNDLDLGDASKLLIVSGRGYSRFASSSGNGCYVIEKMEEGKWRLCIFPSQEYVGAPTRGKAFRSMANRYVNCLKESPVSILKEGKFKFKLNAFGIVSANEILSGKSLEIDKDGALCINEGEYILTVDK